MKKNDDNNVPSGEDIICEYPHVESRKSALPAIAIVILVILIVIGGFYLVRYLKKLDNTQGKANNAVSIEVKIPEAKKEDSVIKVADSKKVTVLQPDKVVEEFYKWYTNYKGNPLTDGAYKSHKSITSELAKKIEKDVTAKSGYDPFLCSKNKATGFSVGTPQTSGKFSSIIVNLNSSDGVTLPKVNLQLENDVWKMVNIACLASDGALGTVENIKKDVGLTYITTKNAEFTWSSANYKGYKAVTVKGSGFSTTNATIKTDAIKNFLVKKGFKANVYNTNGYKKGDVVCVYTDKINSSKKHDVEVECGEIK